MSYNNTLLDKLRKLNQETFEAVKVSRDYDRKRGKEDEEVIRAVEDKLDELEEHLESTRVLLNRVKEDGGQNNDK